jgi:hypothetical protein
MAGNVEFNYWIAIAVFILVIFISWMISTM